MNAEMITCPHCGKENLPQATRCVHCGEDLDEVFKIEGVENTPVPSEGSDVSVSELLQAFRQPDKPAEDAPLPAGAPVPGSLPIEENPQPDKPVEDENQAPEWLTRIRKRAQQEEDAAGELTRKMNSLDNARSTSSQERVDDEFASWIARIRENTRRESVLTPKPPTGTPENEDGVPEWLRRVRELQPDALEEEQPVLGTSAETPAGGTDSNPALNSEPEAEPSGNLNTDAGGGEPTIPEAPEQPASDPIQSASAGQGEELLAESVSAEMPESRGSEPEAEGEQISAADDAGTQNEGELPESSQSPEVEAVLQGIGLAAEDAPVELDERAGAGEEISADLLLLRRQKESAQTLLNLIDEEGKGPPPAKTQRPGGRGWSRFILGSFLLLVLAAVLFFAPETKPRDWENPAPAVALKDRLRALEKGDLVLVVQEYQAATSAEMEQIAVPVLRDMQTRGVELQFLTTHPNGLWLSGSLMDAAGIPARETMFLAGGKPGVLAAALNTDGNSRVVPAGLKSLDSYALILLLEDSQADIQNWIEQAGPWLSPTRLGILASSQNAALLLPYYDAGQLAGFAAGLTEGRVLAQALDQTPPAGAPSRAFQAGLLVMIAVLLLGIISKAEADSSAQHRKEPGV